MCVPRVWQCGVKTCALRCRLQPWIELDNLSSTGRCKDEKEKTWWKLFVFFCWGGGGGGEMEGGGGTGGYRCCFLFVLNVLNSFRLSFSSRAIIYVIYNYVLSITIPTTSLVVVIISTTITVVQLRVSLAWRKETATLSVNDTREVALTKMLVAICCLYVVCVTPTVIEVRAASRDLKLKINKSKAAIRPWAGLA